MPISEEMVQWVGRVLGFTHAEAQENAGPIDALATWRDAKDEVDQRIDALASELRDFGDEDLERIAEFGLFGITDKETVGLNVALMEFQRAPAGEKGKAAKKLRGSIGKYRAAVAGNAMVELLDTAPFSTKVDLKATMFGALDRIERSLPANA